MRKQSLYLEEAYELIDSVRGIPQTLQERKQLSFDLAALMLREAQLSMGFKEKQGQEQISWLATDMTARSVALAIADESFRTSSPPRSADHIRRLLRQYGIPHSLNWPERTRLHLLRSLGPFLRNWLAPSAAASFRKHLASVLLKDHPVSIASEIANRKLAGGIHINLCRCFEPAVSDQEADTHLERILDDLDIPLVDAISIKLPHILQPFPSSCFEEATRALSRRLSIAYRSAIKSRPSAPLPIYLDAGRYAEVRLAAAAFCMTLDDPEFSHYTAGIALPAYFPDSFAIQEELTAWARLRVNNYGAPIRLRILKGDQLALEQADAAAMNWPQAPFLSKMQTDANFKRMLSFACVPENARSTRARIATHNLFDLAFAMLLRSETQTEAYVSFEMFDGLNQSLRSIVQMLSGDLMLYCLTAGKQEWEASVAQLARRFDETTGSENFLRHFFSLKPGTEKWDSQGALFSQSCDEMESLSKFPRRIRRTAQTQGFSSTSFENEPDTDFSLPENRTWAIAAIDSLQPASLPLESASGSMRESISPWPSRSPLCSWAIADRAKIEQSIASAYRFHAAEETRSPLEQRIQWLSSAAQHLRKNRSFLLAVLAKESGLSLEEADSTVSQIVDFIEYNRLQIKRMGQLPDVDWSSKGVILIIGSRLSASFSIANPLAAAIAAGNTVLLKPSSHSIYAAWAIASAFWDAGIPKEMLQWLPCEREDLLESLIPDPRIANVVFSGLPSTASILFNRRGALPFQARVHGKNAFAISALSDRSLAICDLMHSAFLHNGQHPAATAIAICEAEVYDDPSFLARLRNAAQSFKTSFAIHPSWPIGPLIHPQLSALQPLLHLEEGESWLLEPRIHPDCPNLWTPGIKLGVKPASRFHREPVLAPLLGLMRADDFSHAIRLANDVPGCALSILHSLDHREQFLWLEKTRAPTRFINRSSNGILVRRHSFGNVDAGQIRPIFKAGGPNYLRGFLHATQVGLPQEKSSINQQVNHLTVLLEQMHLSAEQLGIWYASTANYAYWWKRLRHDRDPDKILGQDNPLRYLPYPSYTLRLSAPIDPFDSLRCIAAALTVQTQLEVSIPPDSAAQKLDWTKLEAPIVLSVETEDEFIQRLGKGTIARLRLIREAPIQYVRAAEKSNTPISDAPVFANGRLELLHYLQEVSISANYHRYGNLSPRDGELRKPIP